MAARFPKYVRFAAAAVVAAAAGASALEPGGIVSSFHVPGVSLNGPRGLAADGNYTYVVADNRGPHQVRLVKFTYDGESASVVSSFNCPTTVYWAMDLAWRPAAARIYVAEDLASSQNRGRILVLNDDTGSLTNVFNGPYGAGVHVNGLTWDGTHLYVGSFESSVIYKLTYNGTVVSSFSAGHPANHGLAFDGDNVWAVSGRPYFDGRSYTAAGNPVASFNFDVDDAYVGGACRGRADLETVFVSTFTGGQYVYELATKPGAVPGEAVAPATLGRIKALFR